MSIWRLGDSALVKPGDTIATFGSPGGDPGVVDRSAIGQEDNWLEFYNLNLGIVTEVLSFDQTFSLYSEIDRSDETEFYSRAGIRDYGSALQYLFQTDSAINGGNSGGPAINVYGEALGTNTWSRPGFEKVGLFSPVNLLKRSVADMLQYGRVRRPWFGVSLHPPRLDANLRSQIITTGVSGFPTSGVYFETTPAQMKIYTVNPYSPAYNAGLREGDVIRRLDGKTFTNIFDVYSYVLNGQLGQEIVVDYDRESRGMPPITVTLAEKETRYFGSETLMGGFGPMVGSVQHYTADLTY